MHIVHNGSFVPAGRPVLGPGNRSFKWGDGLFETIRVHRRKIALQPLHFERLFTGLTLLQIDVPWQFTAEALVEAIAELCTRNQCAESARVRLAVYRDENNNAGYTIEAVPLEQPATKSAGVIGLYPFARKSTDAFSSVKSASFLPYVLAARFAAEKGWDDALVLNTDGAVCDSSKANIFLIKKEEVYTPPLNSGCVAGVMRRFLVERLHAEGRAVHQRAIREQDLLEADEIFLTNAVMGIQPIERFGDKTYPFIQSASIQQRLVSTIWE